MAKPKHKPKTRANKQVEVWKFQRQLNRPGDTTANVLVYNKASTVMGEFPMPISQVQQLFGKQLKFYATGWKDSKGKVHIEKFLPPQDW